MSDKIKILYDDGGFRNAYSGVARDSQQHHFEERAVFVGCGGRAVEVNETNLLW